MSARRKYGSPSVQTRSSERKRTGTKFSPASSSIEQDTQVASQSMLPNDATFHRCEHCQGLTFDFGQSDDEVRRIVRSLVDDELSWDYYSALALTWKSQARYKDEKRSVLHLTIDRALSTATDGCKVYKAMLSVYPWRSRALFGVSFRQEDSSLCWLEISMDDSIYPPRLPLYVPADSTLAVTVSGRPPSETKWSDSTKSHIKSCMRHCNEYHTLCRLEQAIFRPSNLIEISKDARNTAGLSLRLTSRFEGTPRYAALSYCWGGDQSLKTLKSNIKKFRRNIPYEKMPATLRDAVQVAFDLGFRYLWIDALCLVQNLGTDEIHTLIAEIPEVYRYATLTIAAYSSPRANHGFLRQRKTQWISGVQSTSYVDEGLYESQIQIKDLCGSSGAAMINLLPFNLLKAPINQRGWTLQERILSRRYLLFSDYFVQWTCHESANLEERITNGFNTKVSFEGEEELRTVSHQWIAQKSLNAYNERANYEMWHLVVNAYTGRTLGVVRDIPIAISALAKHFGEAQDYAAGLWLSNLCKDLCWIKRHHHENDVDIGNAFYAPTWSWWSLRTEVYYDVHDSFYELTEDARFRLLDYTLKLAHPSAPFGYILEASLRIEACCGKAIVARATPDKYSRFLNPGVLYWGDNNSFEFDWERPDFFSPGSSLPVQIIPLQWANDKVATYLIVANCQEELNKEPRYSRIGIGHVENPIYLYDEQLEKELSRFTNWLKAQPVEVLTLV